MTAAGDVESASFQQQTKKISLHGLGVTETQMLRKFP